MMRPCSASLIRTPLVLKVFFRDLRILEVDRQHPAALGEADALGEARHGGPGLPAVTLLHADVDLALAVVLAVEAARGVEPALVLHSCAQAAACSGFWEARGGRDWSTQPSYTQPTA